MRLGEKWRCGDAVRRNSNERETEQNANKREQRNFVCGANLKLPLMTPPPLSHIALMPAKYALEFVLAVSQKMSTIPYVRRMYVCREGGRENDSESPPDPDKATG